MEDTVTPGSFSASLITSYMAPDGKLNEHVALLGPNFEKAKEIAICLDKEFKGSNRWLENWKK